jgi:hypothetical protein
VSSWPLSFIVPLISPVHRIYTGTGGYEDKRYGGGGSNRTWGGGMQVADQSFEHNHNNALLVRSHNFADGAGLII